MIVVVIADAQAEHSGIGQAGHAGVLSGPIPTLPR